MVIEFIDRRIDEVRADVALVREGQDILSGQFIRTDARLTTLERITEAQAQEARELSRLRRSHKADFVKGAVLLLVGAVISSATQRLSLPQIPPSAQAAPVSTAKGAP